MIIRNNDQILIDKIKSSPVSDEYRWLFKNRKKYKRKVLLGGFYGAKNVGDELMLEAVLKSAKNKKDIFILLTNNYEITDEDYVPYKTIHSPTLEGDFYVAALVFKKLAICGGALIDDNEYCSENRNTILGIILGLAKEFINARKKVAFIALSTNKKLTNEDAIKDLSEVIKKAEKFSVRDIYSKQVIVNACDICGKKILVTDDLALAQEYEIKPKKKDSIDIGLIFIYNDNFFDILKKITEAIYERAKKDNTKVLIHLIPFYSYKQFDFNMCKKLKESLSFSKDIIVEDMPDNSKKIGRIYSMCDYIVSSRYHALLLANVYNIKTLSLDYMEEHEHYYNKMKYLNEHYGKIKHSISIGQMKNKNKMLKIIDSFISDCQEENIDKGKIRRLQKKVRKEIRRIGKI